MDRPKIRWILHPITLQDSDSRHSPSVSRPLSTLRKKPIEIPTMPLHTGSAGGLSNGRDYRLPYATPGERRVPQGTSDLQHGRTTSQTSFSVWRVWGRSLFFESRDSLWRNTQSVRKEFAARVSQSHSIWRKSWTMAEPWPVHFRPIIYRTCCLFQFVN